MKSNNNGIYHHHYVSSHLTDFLVFFIFPCCWWSPFKHCNCAKFRKYFSMSILLYVLLYKNWVLNQFWNSSLFVCTINDSLTTLPVGCQSENVSVASFNCFHCTKTNLHTNHTFFHFLFFSQIPRIMTLKMFIKFSILFSLKLSEYFFSLLLTMTANLGTRQKMICTEYQASKKFLIFFCTAQYANTNSLLPPFFFDHSVWLDAHSWTRIEYHRLTEQLLYSGLTGSGSAKAAKSKQSNILLLPFRRTDCELFAKPQICSGSTTTATKAYLRMRERLFLLS